MVQALAHAVKLVAVPERKKKKKKRKKETESTVSDDCLDSASDREREGRKKKKNVPFEGVRDQALKVHQIRSRLVVQILHGFRPNKIVKVTHGKHVRLGVGLDQTIDKVLENLHLIHWQKKKNPPPPKKKEIRKKKRRCEK
jgi:hypothetical protein